MPKQKMGVRNDQRSTIDDQRKYTLHLADNNLILGQRLGEWCGHGPVLEQDIALTNIALDLIGQARLLYGYAAEITEGRVTEDDLAFLRNEHEYLNVQLVELPNGDFGQTIMRNFFYDAFNYLNYSALANSGDSSISAIAQKALKEVRYHRRFSSEWVIRLGDGTEESHERMQNAVDLLWPFTGEFFITADYEMYLPEIAPDLEKIKTPWTEFVLRTLEEATLTVPEIPQSHSGGKMGRHTEHMGYLLAELQYMQMKYPGMEW